MAHVPPCGPTVLHFMDGSSRFVKSGRTSKPIKLPSFRDHYLFLSTMPKAYRRKFKKRRRKRRLVTGSFLVNPRSNLLLGRQQLVTLKYNQILNLDSVVNPGVAVNVFRCGGMFDPDVTGTGHQPRGFDELMTLFEHYTVLESTIYLKFPSSVSTVIVGCTIQSSATLLTTLVNYNESRVNKYITMTPGGGSQNIIRLKYSPRGFLGVTNPLSNNFVKGSVATNPSEDAFFHVYTGHMIDGADPGDVPIDVMIYYKAMLTEPFTPNIS